VFINQILHIHSFRENVYTMSFNVKSLQSYEVLKRHNNASCELIEWHFTEIAKSIKRKITLKRKFTDPFTCTVSRDIHKTIFYQAFIAVRDYETKFGTQTAVSRNKKNIVTGYSITFEHFGAFKFHLSKLCNQSKQEVANLLSKSFSCGSKGKVIVTNEKPAVITYNCTRNSLTLKCHYETVNVYGNTTSY